MYFFVSGSDSGSCCRTSQVYVIALVTVSIVTRESREERLVKERLFKTECINEDNVNG